MPSWSKPKKYEYNRERRIKFLKDDGRSDEEIAAILEHDETILPELETAYTSTPVKVKKPKRTAEQKRRNLEKQGDLGLALSGPVGWFLLGRRQNKRKQDAQQDRIESLLRDIRDNQKK
jgi:hypothetical protein